VKNVCSTWRGLWRDFGSVEAEKLRKSVTPLVIIYYLLCIAPTSAIAVLRNDPGATPHHSTAVSGTLGRWHFGGWLGWSGVDLGDFESELSQFAESKRNGFLNYLVLVSSDGNASATTEEATGGFAFGAEIGYQTWEYAGVGLKVTRVMVTDITGDVSGSGIFGESLEYAGAFSPKLTTIMGGAWYQKNRMRLSLYLGQASGSIDTSQSQVFLDPSLGLINSFTRSYRMGSSALALELGAQYVSPLSQTIDGYITVNYRFAKLDKMIFESSVDLDGDGVADRVKGESFTDAAGGMVAFDFSGFILGAGLRIAL